MKKYPAFLLLFIWSNILLAQQTTITEFQQEFITYPYSDPDPIPKSGAIYPYFRYDGYTNIPVKKDWKVVCLENQYIKVWILPEIGGKIWTAIEKSTGKPFIYNNQVVKFRDVALRGAWTSGGIEANYGIFGHTPASHFPVNYITQKNSDGSGSCIIGVLDLLTRTQWTLEIRLPADKAYFTTKSFWFNNNEIEQPYYTWMNAGIKAKGNLQFQYRGNQFLGHDGSTGEWPVKDGNRDISYYDNNDFGGYKSYHVFGEYTDFFGGYWHDEDFGVGRYAPHDEKAGKKIWIWGLSNQGMLWEKLLTDSDGQYVEIQSGRLFTQSASNSVYSPFKYKNFAPKSTDTWTEYWFPVKNTEGFKAANSFGAINLVLDQDQLTFYLNPLQTFNDTVSIYEGDNLIVQQVVHAKPMELIRIGPYQIKDQVKEFKVLMSFAHLNYDSDPDTYKLSRPNKLPEEFNWQTVQGYYIQGKANMDQRFYDLAMLYLDSALMIDQFYLPALADKATLQYLNADYENALSTITKALSIDTYHPQSNYIFGLISLETGKIFDAKDGFGLASISSEYRVAAWTALAKIAFREGDINAAREYCIKCLDFNQQDPEILHLLALFDRKVNNPVAAQKWLLALSGLNPLDFGAAWEKYFLKTSQPLIDPATLIKDELPSEDFLEQAIWYYQLGLYQEAKIILEKGPNKAETVYWLAWLAHLRKDETSAQKLLMAANQIPPDFVFPFRSESIAVFNWANESADSWKSKYYLGLLYLSKRDTIKAASLWNSISNTSDFPPFYMARALSGIRKNIIEIESDMLYAMELDSTSWRFGLKLSQFYYQQKSFQKSVAIASKYYHQDSSNYIIAMQLAKSYLADGQHWKCLDLLRTVEIIPYEGATDGRQLYRKACLMAVIELYRKKDYTKALQYIRAARQWPDNLGVGKPYAADIDSRLENYLDALCAKADGDMAFHDTQLNKIEQFKRSPEMSWNASEFISAMVLKQKGRIDAGLEVLNEWLKQSTDKSLPQYCIGLYSGKQGLTKPITNDQDWEVIEKIIE